MNKTDGRRTDFVSPFRTRSPTRRDTDPIVSTRSDISAFERVASEPFPQKSVLSGASDNVQNPPGETITASQGIESPELFAMELDDLADNVREVIIVDENLDSNVPGFSEIQKQNKKRKTQKDSYQISDLPNVFFLDGNPGPKVDDAIYASIFRLARKVHRLETSSPEVIDTQSVALDHFQKIVEESGTKVAIAEELESVTRELKLLEGWTPDSPVDVAKKAQWIKVCHRLVHIRNTEISLSNAIMRCRSSLKSRIQAEKALYEECNSEDHIEAQGNVFPPQRQRNSSGDSGFLGNEEPVEEEYTATFDEIVDLVDAINERINMMETLADKLTCPDEKAHIRRALYYFYFRVNSRMRQPEPRIDFRVLYRDWRNPDPVGSTNLDEEFPFPIHPQGAGDAMVRHCKMVNRIQEAKIEKGLGKSRKHGHIRPLCSSRPSKSRAPEPMSSSRPAARDKFRASRDAKLDERSIHAQSGILSGLVPDLKLDHATSAKLDTMIGEISKLNENGLTVKLDLLGKIQDSFKDLYKSIVDSSEVKGIILGLVICFAAIKAYQTRDKIWAGITSLLVMVAGFMDISQELRTYISKFAGFATEPPEDLTVELVDETEPPVEAQSAKQGLSECLLSYVYMTMFRDARSSRNVVTDFLKKAGDMPKISSGVGFTIDFFTNLVQKFLDFLTDYLGTPAFELAAHPYPEAVAFAKDCDELSARFTAGLDLNHENGQMYYNLIARGNNISAKIPTSSSEGKSARNMILMSIAGIKSIGNRLARANIVGNGPRIPPVGVLIAGPSGIGKTDMMQFLMNEVTAAILPEDQLEAFERNHNDVTFTRNVENGFWDGYHGQFNVYTDVLGQTKDVAGVLENPYMEHIHMLGPGAYNLNMAHLDDKGNTNFRSKMVYATTNRQRFILNSLEYNEPFCRRFTCSYVMAPTMEYARWNGPETNLFNLRMTHFPPDRTDMSYARFHKFDPETGEVEREKPLTYEQLVQKIIDTYQATHKDGTLMMRLHQTRKEDALRKRRQTMSYPEPEKIEAQSGGDSSESVYHDARETLRASPKLKRDPNVERIALKSGLSYDFVAENLPPEKEDDEIAVARLKIRSEEIRSMPSTSSLSSHWTPYLVEANKYIKVARQKAMEYKKLIVLVSSGLVAAKYLVDYFSKELPSSQSVGGMRKPSGRAHQPASKVNKGKGTFKVYNLKPKNAGRGHVQLRGVRAEAGGDSNAVDILRSVMRRCQFRMCLPDNVTPMGSLTFIVPFIAIAPLHFGERLKAGMVEGEYDENSKITIWNVCTPEQPVLIPVTELEIVASLEGDRQDWCMIRIPEVIQRTPDIRKYWNNTDDIISRGQFTTMLSMVRDDAMIMYQARALPRQSPVKYEQYEITRALQYDIATERGDCGGLLVQINSAIQKEKLIGVHTAGQGARGFGPLILRDEIEYVLSYFDDRADDFIKSDEVDELVIEAEVEGGVEGFEAQCLGRKITQPRKSNILPSPLHNTYAQSTMKPAHMVPVKINGVEKDPLKMARMKYCRPVYAMDPRLLTLVVDYIFSEMARNSIDESPWGKPKVFNFREAVEGIPGVAFCKGLPRDTSAGYPYKLDIPNDHKGKTHFFGKGDAYQFDSDACKELEARVESVIEDAKRGHRRLHVYADFLKDERRPAEKVDQAKTRMISSCPLDLLIIQRMYFLDFVRWVMSNRIHNGSAIGVNCYSSEWHTLTRRFMEVMNARSRALIAGDYSGFDSSMTAQIIRAVLRMINRWYNDEHSAVRAVLWEDICASRHIYDSIIYAWCGHNPSGSFPTTVLNTIVNEILVIYCFVQAYLEERCVAAGDPEWEETVAQAFKLATMHLRMICYGDDNLIAVSEAVEHFFDQGALTRLLATIGYQYTSESKDGVEVEGLRELHEVSFLKRGFVKSEINGRYVAPLELGVILEMPQWTTRRDKKCGYADVRVNIDTALRELSLHPRVVFDEWATHIIEKSWEVFQYAPAIVDYKMLQAITLGQEAIL